MSQPHIAYFPPASEISRGHPDDEEPEEPQPEYPSSHEDGNEQSDTDSDLASTSSSDVEEGSEVAPISE